MRNLPALNIIRMAKLVLKFGFVPKNFQGKVIQKCKGEKQKSHTDIGGRLQVNTNFAYLSLEYP